MRGSRFIAPLVLAWAATLGARTDDAAAGPEGEWWTPGFAARVRIQSCGDTLCGRIVWLWDDAARDAGDAQRPLVGLTIVEAMRRVAANKFGRGRLYNPEDGRDYAGSLTLTAPNRLLVEGCVVFICKTQIWRRYDAQQVPPVARP